MPIETLTYHDKAWEWQIEPANFSNITLLVGVSGVGKTQILESIFNLKRIATGAALSGVKWDVTFSIANKGRYQWQGEFENRGIIIDSQQDRDESTKPKIVYEKLSLNDNLLVDREYNEIFLKRDKTPKLSPAESIIKLLSPEEEISPLYDDLNKMVYSREPSYSLSLTPFDNLAAKHQSLESIQNSPLNFRFRLALAYRNVPQIFEQIKNHFIETFPYVEDIKLEPTTQEGTSIWGTSLPILQIKEKGVEHWIHQTRISDGMTKSLYIISQFYLSAPGTVILIDEFENSLGVNCIDILNRDLLVESSDRQFILTSHHPYIINNVGMEHWKIVTRKGGVVMIRDAAAFNLGKSRHDAFIQLINLEAYTEGIAGS